MESMRNDETMDSVIKQEVIERYKEIMQWERKSNLL